VFKHFFYHCFNEQVYSHFAVSESFLSSWHLLVPGWCILFWIILWVFLNVIVVSLVSFSMSVSTGAVMGCHGGHSLCRHYSCHVQRHNKGDNLWWGMQWNEGHFQTCEMQIQREGEMIMFRCCVFHTGTASNKETETYVTILPLSGWWKIDYCRNFIY